MQKQSISRHSGPLSRFAALAALLFAIAAPSAQAGVIIDFNTAALGIPSTPYSEDGFTLTQDLDPAASAGIGGTDGIFSSGDAGTLGNGTQFFAWCGSCFTPDTIVLSLTNDAGGLFDATSIEFGSYGSGSPTLIAVANFDGGESATTSFASVAGSFTTFAFGASFVGLTSLDLYLGNEFEIGGSSHGAIDNIVLNGIPSVPEPASMFLLGSGLLGLALRRRRRL